MTEPFEPPWPSVPPREGGVLLRRFTPADTAMVMNLATDPYVPHTGTLPAMASEAQALEWIERQQGERMSTVRGLSFAIAHADTDQALGQIGLWLAELQHGRARAGYGIAPMYRGRSVAASALIALTRFAWTLPELHRIELLIEPSNAASIRTAENADYSREGLLRSHQVINGERRDMVLYAAIRRD